MTQNDSVESEPASIDRRTLLKSATAVGLGGGLLTFSTPSVSAQAGGPVILMGIDTEDGGIGGHGPVSTYVGIVNDILSRVTNGNNGILVVGGSANSPVTTFWDRIGTDTGESVTYVRGSTNIRSQSFSGFAMLAVVSSAPETTGGMSQAENDALVSRSADVASFVDNGGGLFGSSQTDFNNAWAYIADIGSFTTNTGLSYSDVTPTTEGNNIGIVDPDLDLCCWHDTFTAWPSFLDVLAWQSNSVGQQAAALGGASVTLQAPDAQCTASFPGNKACVTDTVTFDGSGSSDPDGDDSKLTYRWDFDGDGITDAIGQIVTHSFSSPGQKTVVLTVIDEDGKSSTCTEVVNVVVCNRPPTANCEIIIPNDCGISFPGNVSATGEPIFFDGTGSSDPDGDVLTFEWDFDGDGITDATGAVVKHTFTTGGKKTVTLTVTDEHGASDTCTLTLTVAIKAEIDVKPCSEPSPINPRSRGVTPVSVKQTSTFNPTERIDVGSLRFGDPEDVKVGSGASPAHNGHVEDTVPCGGDGRNDLVLHFPTRDAGFDGDENTGRLEGMTHDGVPVFGEDRVRLVGR
ncbi:hypothetical protein HFX_6171 (plasmid) [Haloferax mediterranei ATCC 33500]|nr:hypothetical protein HFX_6171 [Haloferax mediterranei ATCC 33500]